MNKYTLLKILISLALIYYTIKKVLSNISFQDISFDFSNIHYLLIAFLLIALSLFTANHQWYLLLKKQKIMVSYKICLKIFLVGLFFNHFFISSVSGEFKKVYDLKKHTGNYHLGISATFFDKFLNLLALIFLGFFFSLFFLFEKNLICQNIFGVFSLLLLICLLFFLYIFVPKIHNLCLMIFKKIKFLNDKIQILNSNFYNFKDAKLLFKTIIISLFTQFIRIYAIYLIALFLGVNTAFFYFIFFIPLIFVITMFPISVGGFGPRELSSQILFAQVGVNALNSVLFQLINYVFFAGISLIGFYFFLKEKKENTNH